MSTRNGRYNCDSCLGGRLLVAAWYAILAGTAAAEPPVEWPVAAAPVLVVGDTPVTLAETMQIDAALADVAFIDRATGWAVGDRGVIWHTADGGRTWQLQPSGVTCRLHSVSFLDARRGWAAGGASQPYSSASRGVLLSTTDGGATWQALPPMGLPVLTRIKFFSADQGVAVGGGSDVFPSGVFVTRDGGRTWQTVPGDDRGTWLAADFVDAETGAVAGVAGQFATLMRRRVSHAPSAFATLRSYRALVLAPPTSGWLVGDGGLVMTTRDLGRTWQSPSGPLPEWVGEHFDFQTVAHVGSHVWVAGSPGTRVFHSPDDGRTWKPLETGGHAPLRAMKFVDTTTGWAVGDLGTILATNDGGRSWHVQRQGGRRAALVAVFARETDVPLELLAKFSGEEGYLAAVEVLSARDGPSRADGRVHEALVSAGATAAELAWRFPLPSDDLALGSDDLLAELNRATDGRAVERLQSHLVRQLRLWRPDVVVTQVATDPDGDPLGSIVGPLVAASLAAAADPAQYPELKADVGLDAWQVKRVYGVWRHGTRGESRIMTGEFAPRLGATLAEWTEPARRLLSSGQTPTPEAVELQVLRGEPTGANDSNDLFAGIPLMPGGDARRRLANLSGDDPAALRRLALRRRQMRTLLERTAGNAAWAAQVANLTDGLDPASAGELSFELAENYRASGRLDLAADTYAMLARRWPDHPLVEPALRWLVAFYASSEIAQRLVPAGAANVRDGVSEQGVRQASAVERLRADSAPDVGLSRDDRLRRAALLGEYLEAARPALFAEPSVRFPLVVAQRQLGFANPAKRYFLTLRSLPENDPWRGCAATEEWFADASESPPPKTLGTCRRTTERPHLDGRLDELCWQSADRLRLRGRDSFSTGERDSTARRPVEKESRPRSTPAEVRLVYDRAFLYLAIRCPQVAGVGYETEASPRPRDADLSAHDRVAMRLDVDRDYTTAFELTVDSRGWVHDACWGDASWDPTWFVAADVEAESWTVEAAIPLAQLVADPPDARHVWAVAIRRTIPRTGYESWCGDPADADSPDQFGLLIYE